MLPDGNPPLRVGQTLEPRKTSTRGKSRLADFRPHGPGMLWLVDDGTGGEWLTLSDIYREFEFAN